ncbi:MAG: MarR family transcriptional regulator [Cocleimonas sp.]
MPNKRKRKAKIENSLLETTVESEIFIGALSFSDQTLAEVHELLSIWGMTPLQYNAMRVIYAKDKEDIGLPSKEIGSRLYTRVPDVTRLLDRMVDKGWITRERDTVNKRVVRSRLTDIGIELVESAHAPLMELESKQLAHLSNDEKNTLFELLNKALDK